MLPPEALRLARAALTRAEAARAGNDIAAAERWFERCHRLVPHDDYVALQLALVSLGRDSAKAEGLFARLAARFDLRDVWLGLAAARLSLGNTAGAAAALASALSRHAIGADVPAVADLVARAADAAGWCGLASDGALTIAPAGPVDLRLDGQPVRRGQIPDRIGTARSLTVTRMGRDLLGSPIDVAAIRRTEGFVEAHAGGLRGWIWHPGDPARDPVLTVSDGTREYRLRIGADGHSEPVADSGPAPGQRQLAIPAADLRGLDGPLHVRGSDDRDLMGSPLDPGFWQRGATAGATLLAQLYPTRPGRGEHGTLAKSASRSRTPPPHRHGRPCAGHDVRDNPDILTPMLPAPVEGPFPPPASDRRRRGVDVVIPVYGNTAMTLACLDSVLPTVPSASRVVVVDDASDDPSLTEYLNDLARARRIRLVRNPRNLGFPASANAGMARCAGRDVVLLNSDTLVPPGWLERLRAAAHSAADIGTVTPFSNSATIMTWPGAAPDDRMPDQAETTRLDRIAQRTNGAATADIPVGVGFCLYLRRDCLDQTGLLRADLFAQGYGEEVDFCLRARHLGWRHVGATGVFVAHGSGRSFGPAGRHLQVRNENLLNRLHPGYAAMVQDFIAADPLFEARRRLDLTRWRAGRRPGGDAAILVTHNDGGGVERQVAAAAAAHRAAGRRTIVLRPARLAAGQPAIAVCDGNGRTYPDLRFALPDEMAALLRLLRAERGAAVEIHHFLDHHASVYLLLKQLGLPYAVHVHDYPWFCQRVSLVGVQDRYCGEPDTAGCEACIADTGRLMEEDISVTALLHRSARFLAAAQRVVAPTEDAAARMRRHFPALRPVVIPHEDDAALAEPAVPQARDGRCRVCVAGAVGVHKGYEILLACARDAAARDLPLDFILVGTSIDDARLIATGRVFVTGYYQPEEAVALIRRQNASLALLPSIWPETWCLVLTEIWRAGLQAVAFDLGAQAERIRRTGRGFVLPPNLPARAINDRLVASVGLSRHDGLLPGERK